LHDTAPELRNTHDHDCVLVLNEYINSMKKNQLLMMWH